MAGDANPIYSRFLATDPSTPVLEIPATVHGRLETLAVAGYPNEVCGLLLGGSSDGRTVVAELVPARNLNTERARDRYVLDPDDFLNAEKRARELGLDVVGIWHTHPDHPAIPSTTDLDAAWPGYSYVIAAVTRRGVVDVRSWRLRDGGFETEKVVLP